MERKKEISTTQVNALDHSSVYAFIAYYEDRPTYESCYQLLPRVGLVKDDGITRQKMGRKRRAAAAYAMQKFAKGDL